MFYSCPYDTMTIYDGDSPTSPVIVKTCGLQQTQEIFSRANELFVEFRSTDPPFAEHRGFNISYTISNDYVDVGKFVTIMIFITVMFLNIPH